MPEDSANKYLTYHYNLRDRQMQCGDSTSQTATQTITTTTPTQTATTTTTARSPTTAVNTLSVNSSSTTTTAASSITTTANTSSVNSSTTTASSSTTTASIPTATITSDSSPTTIMQRDNGVQLAKFTGKSGKVSATQWWTLFIQWCSLHSFTEQQILGRIVFHLADMAQQWYLSLPETSRSTLQSLKSAFFSRFGKQSSFNLDVLDIKQQIDETCEEYITRIQQMACDDEIPSLMLISLIAKGFQPDISEKVLDKDPQTFEDLFKFAKRAESTVKIRKNDSLIASIEGMEDRLMTKLSKQLETTVMALDRRDQYAPAEVHDRYTSSNQQNNSHTNVHTRNHGRPRGHDFRSQRHFKSESRDRPQFSNNASQYGPRNQGNRFPRPTPPSRQHGYRPAQNQRHPSPSKCPNCFMDNCDQINCIAFGKHCFYCHGVNHFQIACFSNPASPLYRKLTSFDSNQ